MSINYTHRINTRSKRINLTVKPSGEVLVTTPRFTPKFLINQFVSQNQAWIAKQQAKQATTPQLQTKQFVYLFGRKYLLAIKELANKTPGFFIEGKNLIYNPIASTKRIDSPNKDKLDKFLKLTAKSYILPRTQQLAKKMKIKFNRLTLRQQKSRWGSCSNAGNLNFNWRLVHFQPAVIDYVIIHELAHRQQMNHSEHFWQIVRKFDPEFPKHRGVLKRYQVGVEWGSDNSTW